MQYRSTYLSPLGTIVLAADDIGLTGLWFEGQKHFERGLAPDATPLDVPVLQEAKSWLTLYFSGEIPDFIPPLHLIGTPFQVEIWRLLLTIPYGQTLTYRAIARAYAQRAGLSSMSAQAVGNAVGKNPISILVPCHRVVGAKGQLTGYAGGLARKQALLKLEQ